MQVNLREPDSMTFTRNLIGIPVICEEKKADLNIFLYNVAIFNCDCDTTFKG